MNRIQRTGLVLFLMGLVSYWSGSLTEIKYLLLAIEIVGGVMFISGKND